MIINEWFGIARWFFNRTIEFCEENKVYDYKKVKLGMRELVSRSYPLPDWWSKDKTWTIQEKEISKIIPPRLISGAISDCCKAYKTCFSLLKNKIIRKFQVHPRVKKDPSQTLYFESCCFSKKGILFPRACPMFGQLKGEFKRHKTKIPLPLEMNKDCRLSFKNGLYYLFVPEEQEKEMTFNDGTWVSIDSGCRTFQSCYSPDGHTIEFGVNMKQSFNRLLNKIDAVSSIRDKCARKSKRTQLAARLQRARDKLKNRVKDMHWKTIKCLTSNYSTIIISKFQVASILQNKCLGHATKRLLQVQSHYQFRKRLEEKCFMRNVEFFAGDEAWTSKDCSWCGTINRTLGSSKDFDCSSCGVQVDRDLNAARNIGLKHFESQVLGNKNVLYLEPFSPPGLYYH